VFKVVSFWLVASVIIASAGSADDYVYLYTQPMEGVCSQGGQTDHLRE
jgi:hypothetical protein